MRVCRKTQSGEFSVRLTYRYALYHQYAECHRFGWGLSGGTAFFFSQFLLHATQRVCVDITRYARIHMYVCTCRQKSLGLVLFLGVARPNKIKSKASLTTTLGGFIAVSTRVHTALR